MWLLPYTVNQRESEAMVLCFSSGSSTSVGAARWPGTVAPSASRRTGLLTRSTVGRGSVPSSMSLSLNDDGQESPLPQVRGFQLFRGHSGDRLAVEVPKKLVVGPDSHHQTPQGTCSLRGQCPSSVISSRDNGEAPQDLSHYLYVNMFVNSCTVFLGGR
jgi:hypothetical protein